MFATVVARGNRRRLVRRAGGVAVVALLLVAGAFALPNLRPPLRIDPAPAVHRTNTPRHPVTGAPGFPAPVDPTSIDGLTWTTSVMSETARRHALRGTGLERYGHRVFVVAGMRGNQERLRIQHGQVRFRPGVYNRGEGPSITGSYTSSEHVITMTLDSWPGTTTLRWHVTNDGTLTLTFIDTTLRARYGAPAEAFLRMSLTASPFRRDSGY